MPDDGVIQLRRNPSKQMLARNHVSRHGKTTKGNGTRTNKISNSNTRKIHGLPHSNSQSSLNQASNAGNTGANTETGDPAHYPSPRNNGTSHRLPRGKSNASLGVGNGVAFGSHRYRGLSSGLGNLAQTHRKPVIQLEREDEDEDEDDNVDDSDNPEFEDFDDDDEDGEPPQRPSAPGRSDSQLSIGIQPVGPTPPKLSEETVISVSSLADMASALKGARDKSGFVGSEDLISTAVNRSKNLGNMAQMVHGWNSSSQRGSTHPNRKSSVAESSKNGSGNSTSIPGEEDPREYEKVFREYTNTRAICNPVISSLYRISISHSNTEQQHRSGTLSSSNASVYGDSTNNGFPRIQLPSVKKVNSLVATTANQMSDYSETSVNNLFPERYASPQSHGAIESVSTYTLNKIWQMGWEDPEYSSELNHKMPSQPPRGIQGQAMRVQQQLNNTRDKQRGYSAKQTQ